MVKYCCEICMKKSKQKSAADAHINTPKHKDKCKIFKLQLKENGLDFILKHYPQFENKFENIDDLLDLIVKSKESVIMDNKNNQNNEPEPEIPMELNITNREALKEKIHEIHNFLRNNGAGYGMNALKVFNIFYGLKKIEENNLFDKVGDLDEVCRFSKLLEISKNGDSELCDIIYDKVLESLYNSQLKYFLFYEIPRNMKGNIFSHLLRELDQLTKIEQSCGEQLTGKIYEYFIGRDRQAISELGAYFTNRLIVEYIYKQLDLELEDDGSIGSMVDPFGGSGGFTTGYINWMKEKHPNIIWTKEIEKIHHYDMNEDVIKSAALEFFCMTGEIPKKEHLEYKNSFTDEFNNQRYKYCITNPPYGGDKNSKSDAEKKRDKIVKFIKDELKTLKDKDKIKLRQKQLKDIDNLNKLEKKRQDEQKVTLSKSSKRIKEFAKKYKLNGNDKESVSLILMMDMVEKGGVGCGVLKEGVFFNSTYKNLRKCLLENFNVTKVISIPKDQFENTSTKTSIVIFKNTEDKTSSVQFYDLSCVKYTEDKLEEIDGQIVLTENKDDVKGVEDKLVSVASIEDILNQKDISLNGKVYTNRLFVPGDNYELYSLKDITTYQKGKPIKVKGENLSGDFGIVSGGGGICGWYHKYNRVENTILLSSSGNAGYVSRYPIKIWASDCWSIHSQDTEILTEDYLYYYLKIIQDIIYEYQTGSVIKHLKFEDIENLKISIPKDKQKMIEWSDKISEPYNEKIEKSQRIKELQKELQDRVKYIFENEECEEKMIGELGDICCGSNLPKNKATNGKYKVYGGGKSNYTHKDFNRYGFDILISRVGNNGITLIFEDYYLTDNGFAIDCNTKHIKYYMGFYLLLNPITCGNGSAQKVISKTNLKKIKLKIPKNKQLIEDMEPQFQELEHLHIDVDNADKKYKQLINDLRNEAIKQ